MPIPTNNQFNLFDKEGKTDSNQVLWDRFVRLGERIGDGDMDASEAKWVNREYKKLMLILCPDIKESLKVKRKQKAQRVNEQMLKLLQIKKCECGGSLRQSRSGSKIAYCTICNNRYKARKTNAK